MPNIHFVTGYDSYNQKNVIKAKRKYTEAQEFANTLTDSRVNSLWYENESDLVEVFNSILSAQGALSCVN